MGWDSSVIVDGCCGWMDGWMDEILHSASSKKRKEKENGTGLLELEKMVTSNNYGF